MTKTMILGALAATAGLLLAGASLAEPAAKAAAPAKGTAEAVGQNRKAGAKDENVKSASLVNDPNKKDPKGITELPPAKGGKKTRGDGPIPCYIKLDNRTPWRVQIFVDGELHGVLPRFGDAVAVTGNGFTTLYGVAAFTDGSALSFGPQAIDCQKVFTWTLRSDS